MGELDRASVAAANDAWVWTPEGSAVVEAGEYRLVRFPERFPEQLQVQWVRSARPAEAVLADVVAPALAFGLPEAYVCVKLGAPDGFDEALLGMGAHLVDTADVLALGLPATVAVPDFPGLEVRWVATPEDARDADAVGVVVFGGTGASDDELTRQAAADRVTVAAGTGGTIVAYVDGSPVAVAGVEIVDGVARLWGGAVLAAYRGRGVYRALVAARLTYAAGHGATMGLTRGRIATSSPILRGFGFVSYGQERSYRLALG
jgi:GNAT superfamily N-acetyltransferase